MSGDFERIDLSVESWISCLCVYILWFSYETCYLSKNNNVILKAQFFLFSLNMTNWQLFKLTGSGWYWRYLE